MTAEEIRGKIDFSLLPGETDDSRLIVGTLKIESQLHVSKECFTRPELLQHLKNEIGEAILNRIYQDQRNAIAYAVMKMLESHYPANHSDAMEAQELLMKAARYQEAEREGK